MKRTGKGEKKLRRRVTFCDDVTVHQVQNYIRDLRACDAELEQSTSAHSARHTTVALEFQDLKPASEQPTARQRSISGPGRSRRLSWLAAAARGDCKLARFRELCKKAADARNPSALDVPPRVLQALYTRFGLPRSYNKVSLEKPEFVASADKYEGSWLDGVFHGHGKLSRADGSYYEGEWKNGIRCGHGKEVTKTSEYIGGWQGGNPCGHGDLKLKKTTDSSVLSYTGDFDAGQFHGDGTLKLEKEGGISYRGPFSRGEPADMPVTMKPVVLKMPSLAKPVDANDDMSVIDPVEGILSMEVFALRVFLLNKTGVITSCESGRRLSLSVAQMQCHEEQQQFLLAEDEALRRPLLSRRRVLFRRAYSVKVQCKPAAAKREGSPHKEKEARVSGHSEPGPPRDSRAPSMRNGHLPCLKLNGSKSGSVPWPKTINSPQDPVASGSGVTYSPSPAGYDPRLLEGGWSYKDKDRAVIDAVQPFDPDMLEDLESEAQAASEIKLPPIERTISRASSHFDEKNLRILSTVKNYNKPWPVAELSRTQLHDVLNSKIRHPNQLGAQFCGFDDSTVGVVAKEHVQNTVLKSCSKSIHLPHQDRRRQAEKVAYCDFLDALERGIRLTPVITEYYRPLNNTKMIVGKDIPLHKGHAVWDLFASYIYPLTPSQRSTSLLYGVNFPDIPSLARSELIGNKRLIGELRQLSAHGTAPTQTTCTGRAFFPNLFLPPCPEQISDSTLLEKMVKKAMEAKAASDKVYLDQQIPQQPLQRSLLLDAQHEQRLRNWSASSEEFLRGALHTLPKDAGEETLCQDELQASPSSPEHFIADDKSVEQSHCCIPEGPLLPWITRHGNLHLLFKQDIFCRPGVYEITVNDVTDDENLLYGPRLPPASVLLTVRATDANKLNETASGYIVDSDEEEIARDELFKADVAAVAAPYRSKPRRKHPSEIRRRDRNLRQWNSFAHTRDIVLYPRFTEKMQKKILRRGNTL